MKSNLQTHFIFINLQDYLEFVIDVLYLFHSKLADNEKE